MFGREIGAPPSKLDGTAVLVRFIDGLAYRYYWATDGLRPADFDFRPGADSMSTFELHVHILHLAFMIRQTILNAAERERFETEDPAELRALTLSTLRGVREHLEGITDEAIAKHQVLKRDGRRFPVWNIMNGPMSDALTHVGQINAWRRLNGNPARPVDVFAGLAPDASLP